MTTTRETLSLARLAFRNEAGTGVIDQWLRANFPKLPHAVVDVGEPVPRGAEYVAPLPAFLETHGVNPLLVPPQQHGAIVVRMHRVEDYEKGSFSDGTRTFSPLHLWWTLREKRLNNDFVPNWMFMRLVDWYTDYNRNDESFACADVLLTALICYLWVEDERRDVDVYTLAHMSSGHVSTPQEHLEQYFAAPALFLMQQVQYRDPEYEWLAWLAVFVRCATHMMQRVYRYNWFSHEVHSHQVRSWVECFTGSLKFRLQFRHGEVYDIQMFDYLTDYEWQPLESVTYTAADTHVILEDDEKTGDAVELFRAAAKVVIETADALDARQLGVNDVKLSPEPFTRENLVSVYIDE